MNRTLGKRVFSILLFCAANSVLAQNTPVLPASQPAAQAGKPTPRTVEFLYQSVVNAWKQPFPSMAIDFSKAALQSPDVMAVVQQQANAGNPHAQDLLGMCFDYGWGVAQDYAQAVSWFRKAAEQGDADAQNNLGFMYVRGKDVPQDYARAASWYRKAADKGYALAQYSLGVMYTYGQGVPQDYAQAVSWYRKAAEQGFAKAQNNLGDMYYLGQGMPQDYAQAASWFRKAADKGYAPAQYSLSVMYANGQGVPQDDAQAAIWYRKAAEQGNAGAQHNLQGLMTTGKTPVQIPLSPGELQTESVDSLYKQIIKAEDSVGIYVWRPIAVKLQSAKLMAMVRSQAELGNAHAQDVLAHCYSHGWGGLSQDDVQAAMWYRKAAEQGVADAQSRLGDYYSFGWGVPEDDTQAVFWTGKAADQGHAYAQNALASQYEVGLGVPQNRIVAYALYDLAATNGSTTARHNRNQLAQKLSAKDLELAERLEQQMRADKRPTVAIKGFLAMQTYDRMENSRAEQLQAAPNSREINNKASGNNPWPARPAKIPGQTTCNTRCINGSCWRTYDNGRRVHLNVPPSIDPFTGQMTFKTPPC